VDEKGERIFIHGVEVEIIRAKYRSMK